jgi:hypothetical protein
MRKRCAKQYTVIVVSLLFLGVAVAPNIDLEIVKASHPNNIVEVITQACGMQGYGNTTVNLTRQQYQRLTQYFVEFNTRLNQTTTPQTAVQIFKDALVELNAYGLLPKGMTVEQAQRMVERGQTRIQATTNLVHRFMQSSINYFCLFAGVFHGAFEDNIFGRIATWIYDHMDLYIPPLWPAILYVVLYAIFVTINWVKVARIMNTINVSGNVDSFFSIGLAGIRSGHYAISRVTGFTGIKIILEAYQPSGYAFYLGFALDIS